VEIKIALPKGRLLSKTAALLDEAGWGLKGYYKDTRLYRLTSRRFSGLFLKVFQEKDVPIQVAVGNYDLGICGLDWVEELLVKYSSSALVKVKNLGHGAGVLYIVASRSAGVSTIEELKAKSGIIRIASEYPNLAESFASRYRLRQFSIFPLWGAAEVYPPESADLALVPAGRGENFNYALMPLTEVLSFSAYLIANKSSWESKDVGDILATLYDSLDTYKEPANADKALMTEMTGGYDYGEVTGDTVWLALPDGHQQLPTAELLSKAGIEIDDYPSAIGNRRPTAKLAGVKIKVIRPQDMPLQVANGNFDLAITGRDWLMDHLYQFPSSPVRELLDLKMGRVKIVAVVSRDLPLGDINDLRRLAAERSVPLRVASEYVNIADKYARDNHLGMYRVIPTWGASEAFLPEDADLLIENTQTGRTIVKHNLKILATLFQSTACLIGSSLPSPNKAKRVNFIIETLRQTVEAI